MWTCQRAISTGRPAVFTVAPVNSTGAHVIFTDTPAPQTRRRVIFTCTLSGFDGSAGFFRVRPSDFYWRARRCRWRASQFDARVKQFCPLADGAAQPCPTFTCTCLDTSPGFSTITSGLMIWHWRVGD